MNDIEIILKDGRNFTLRNLTQYDRDRLVEMFSTMSTDSLKWSMAPYTPARVQRWIDNLTNLLTLIAEFEGRIIGYTQVHIFTQPRRKGVGELLIYIHEDYHGIGLGTTMTKMILELVCVSP